MPTPEYSFHCLAYAVSMVHIGMNVPKDYSRWCEMKDPNRINDLLVRKVRRNWSRIYGLTSCQTSSKLIEFLLAGIQSIWSKMSGCTLIVLGIVFIRCRDISGISVGITRYLELIYSYESKWLS